MAKVLTQSLLVAVFLICHSAAITPEEYERNINFYKFVNTFQSKVKDNSTFNSTIAGCDLMGNFSMIVHGWTEGLSTAWVEPLISNLLHHRGGCVFFMDYSNYSNVTDYFALVNNFAGISAVLLKKVNQIGNFDRQFIFGFSLGARLSIDVGLKVGNQRIGRMDLCDPAGPGFDIFVDPKPAAKNVECINTSTDKGTPIYNCHQNFRMGFCGFSQAASGSYPVGSHGLCPYFYNLAFTHDFVNNNFHNCVSDRPIKDPPNNVKMGYLGAFNRTQYVGDIFIVTAKYPPFIVDNNLIDNQLPNLLEYLSCDSNKALRLENEV